MGDPNSVAMAAKLPATPITTMAIGGASRLNRWMARTPRPLPIAISGASGPTTAPRLSVAKAAATMPKSSTGGTGPPALKPSEGSWPPVPGRNRMASATSSPHSVSQGSGHQSGAPWNPRLFGRSVKISFWTLATASRKKYATAATGTPMMAPNNRRTT